MSDPARQEVVARSPTVVVKVGTNVLADATGRLDRGRIQSLADAGGRQVVLVTSGAIGAGVGKLGLKKRPADLPQLQACAAVEAACRVGQHVGADLYDHRVRPGDDFLAGRITHGADSGCRFGLLSGSYQTDPRPASRVAGPVAPVTNQ